ACSLVMPSARASGLPTSSVPTEATASAARSSLVAFIELAFLSSEALAGPGSLTEIGRPNGPHACRSVPWRPAEACQPRSYEQEEGEAVRPDRRHPSRNRRRDSPGAQVSAKGSSEPRREQEEA